MTTKPDQEPAAPAKPWPEQWAKEFFNYILYHQTAAVAEVIKKHPDCIHWKHPGDQTPLMNAVRQGYNDIAEMLLKAGAPTGETISDFGWTAFIYAGRDNNAAALDLLLKYGSNVREQGSGGDTALTQALDGRHSFVALRLIELGSDIEAKVEWSGNTPLLCAAWNGDAAVCAALIRAGANLDAVNGRGQNALDIARQCGAPTYNTENQKWLDTLAVLEPVYAAKAARERLALGDKVGDEMGQGIVQAVAVRPALKLKRRASGLWKI